MTSILFIPDQKNEKTLPRSCKKIRNIDTDIIKKITREGRIFDGFFPFFFIFLALRMIALNIYLLCILTVSGTTYSIHRSVNNLDLVPLTPKIR